MVAQKGKEERITASLLLGQVNMSFPIEDLTPKRETKCFNLLLCCFPKNVPEAEQGKLNGNSLLQRIAILVHNFHSCLL